MAIKIKNKFIIKDQIFNIALMQKFIFFVLFVAIFFDVSNSNAQIKRAVSFDDQEACDENKGVWREFGNGCGDECSSKFDQYSICTSSIIFACDCGKGRCWNKDKCMLKKEYKIIYEKDLEKTKILLEKKAEERREKIKNNPALTNYLTNIYGNQTKDQNQAQGQQSQGQGQQNQAQGQQNQPQGQQNQAGSQPQNFANPNQNATNQNVSQANDPQPTTPITQVNIAPTDNKEIPIPAMFLNQNKDEPQFPVIPLPQK